MSKSGWINVATGDPATAEELETMEYADEFNRTRKPNRPPLKGRKPRTPMEHMIRDLRLLMARNEMPKADSGMLDPRVGEAGRVPIIGRDRGALPGDSPEDVVGPIEEQRTRDLPDPALRSIPPSYRRYLDQILEGDPEYEEHRKEVLGPSSDMSKSQVLIYAAEHEAAALSLLRLYHCGGETRDPERGWQPVGWERRLWAYDQFRKILEKRRTDAPSVDHFDIDPKHKRKQSHVTTLDATWANDELASREAGGPRGWFGLHSDRPVAQRGQTSNVGRQGLPRRRVRRLLDISATTSRPSASSWRCGPTSKERPSGTSRGRSSRAGMSRNAERS